MYLQIEIDSYTFDSIKFIADTCGFTVPEVVSRLIVYGLWSLDNDKDKAL